MLKEHCKFLKIVLLSRNHRTDEAEGTFGDHSFQPLLKAVSTTAGGSGLFQSGSEYLQGWKLHDLTWISCSSVQSPFQ